MKRFALISTIPVIVLLGLLASRVLSQKTPGTIEAFHQSLTYESAKDYSNSIRALQSVYRENSTDYLLNLRLGWLQYLAKNYQESKKFYGTAASLANNRSVEALLGKTLPLASLNDWDGVAESYREVLKQDPANYTANLRLGQILLNRGSYSEARGYLEKVYSLYPGSYEPNLSLGWTYYYLGNKQKATGLLTTALMLSPGDTLAQKGLNLLK